MSSAPRGPEGSRRGTRWGSAHLGTAPGRGVVRRTTVCSVDVAPGEEHGAERDDHRGDDREVDARLQVAEVVLDRLHEAGGVRDPVVEEDRQPAVLDQGGGVVAEQPRLPPRVVAPARRSRRSPGRRTRCRAPRRCSGRGWSARRPAAPARTVSSTPRAWVCSRSPQNPAGQRLAVARPPRAGSPTSPASPPGPRRRAAVAPPTRTASLVPMTRIRCGTQNSSATSDRVDHSAPIQVAPIRPARTAEMPAKPRAPAMAAWRRSRTAPGRGRTRASMSSRGHRRRRRRPPGPASGGKVPGVRQALLAELLVVGDVLLDLLLGAGELVGAGVAEAGSARWRWRRAQPSQREDEDDLDEAAGTEAVQLRAQESTDCRPAAPPAGSSGADGCSTVALMPGSRRWGPAAGRR